MEISSGNRCRPLLLSRRVHARGPCRNRSDSKAGVGRCEPNGSWPAPLLASLASISNTFPHPGCSIGGLAQPPKISGSSLRKQQRVDPFFVSFDEIDSLGSGRQDAVRDPGGAGREFSNITMALMSEIDHCHHLDGFLLMAATNRLDGLDEALIREGRLDVKIRIDLPDERTRIKILDAQLGKKPWKRFDVQEFARRTPGASAAKLRALVDEAAGYALADNRKIQREDLVRALNGSGGRDRPNLEVVE